MKKTFILHIRHDISLHQLLIMMKIYGTHLQIPIGIPNLFQGKNQNWTTVICLNSYRFLALFFKIYSLILPDDSLDVKSSLCMTRLWPRDSEKIQIDPINLILSQKSPAAILLPPGFKKQDWGKTPLLQLPVPLSSACARYESTLSLHLNSHKFSDSGFWKSCHITSENAPSPYQTSRKKAGSLHLHKNLHSTFLILNLSALITSLPVQHSKNSIFAPGILRNLHKQPQLIFPLIMSH